jgi:hypothetical protein
VFISGFRSEILGLEEMPEEFSGQNRDFKYF